MSTEKSLISFDCSLEDAHLIKKIVQRGVEMSARYAVPIDSLQAAMDITAVHCNGTRLKLWQFYASDNSDFSHDFAGIGIHIDRETGKLKNCFVPRFADVKH